MPDDHLARPAAHHEPGTHFEDPPDLGPVWALAECEEFADAARRLADGCGNRLRGDDPQRPLAAQLTRSLTEAGFTPASLRDLSPAVPPRRSLPAAGSR